MAFVCIKLFCHSELINIRGFLGRKSANVPSVRNQNKTSVRLPALDSPAWTCRDPDIWKIQIYGNGDGVSVEGQSSFMEQKEKKTRRIRPAWTCQNPVAPTLHALSHLPSRPPSK